MQLSPISLAITRLGGVRFSPAALFPSGVQGAWYDPSDSSTLFEDTAGTTPSPTPGGGALSVVGLMLDKSQGGVGTNGAYRYNLLTYSEQFNVNDSPWERLNLVTVSANAAVAPDGTTTAEKLIAPNSTGTGRALRQALTSGVNGVSYVSSFYAKYVSGELSWIRALGTDAGVVWFDIQNGVRGTVTGVNTTGTITSVGNGWYRCVITSTASSVNIYSYLNPVDADGSTTTTGDGSKGVLIWGAQLALATSPTAYQRIDANWYSTMAGNHAISYNTTTARPELSARVNLLTYSEQFDNAAWTKIVSTITPNAVIAPDGTLTADRWEGAAGSAFVFNNSASISGTYTISFWVKAVTPGTNNQFRLALSGGSGGAISSDFTATANWQRFEFTGTATTANNSHGIARNSLNAATDLYIWGADLRPANIGASVPAYQRIADQYTYDSSGFPLYLVFNGTASGMYTPANLNLSGTDKVTVFAGVRKISDAARGLITELSATAGNVGTFVLEAPSTTSGADYRFGSGGSLPFNSTAIASGLTAPISNVVTGFGDISGDLTRIRVNGVQVGTGTNDQGTGNYGTYPLYIGSRASSSLWLNGYIYSLIVVGAASTAAQITSTESWINVKEGGVY